MSKIENKIKIIFVLPSLVAGGAERVISFIAQNIDKNKFEPILLIAGYSKDTVYNIKNIQTIYLNKSRILFALPHITYQIHKLKPQIVVSAISHTNKAMSIIAPFFKGTKFIGREATILSKRKKEKASRRWSLNQLISKDFKNLDVLICQSKDMAEDMISNYNIPSNKIHIINNPISNLHPVKTKNTVGTIKKFITVGRLTEVKGHLRILKILSQLQYRFEYTIIGNGAYLDTIKQEAQKLDLLENIIHIPFTDKVSDYISKNDYFLQGSFVEGFPNASLESCVVGTPVIAFNAPGGTKEIIINGINGYLVNEENEFLERLKGNETWDPEQIRESVYKKFNKEKILNQYENLFIEILK